MTQTLAPSIGYIPSGQINGPRLILGGNPTGAWDGVGLGANGRADLISGLLINVTDIQVGVSPTVPGVLNINSADLMKLIAMNATSGHVPTQLNFKLTELSICEESVEKRIVVLASQTYPKPNGA